MDQNEINRNFVNRVINEYCSHHLEPLQLEVLKSLIIRCLEEKDQIIKLQDDCLKRLDLKFDEIVEQLKLVQAGMSLGNPPDKG